MSKAAMSLEDLVTQEVHKLYEEAKPHGFTLDVDNVESVFNEEKEYASLYSDLKSATRIAYLRGLADGLNMTVGEMFDEFLAG